MKAMLVVGIPRFFGGHYSQSEGPPLNSSAAVTVSVLILHQEWFRINTASKPQFLLVFCWLLLASAVAHVSVSVSDGGDLPGQDVGIWHPEGPIQLLNWPNINLLWVESKPAEGRSSDVPSSPFVNCLLFSHSLTVHHTLLLLFLRLQYFECFWNQCDLWPDWLPLSASFIINFIFFRLNLFLSSLHLLMHC